MNIIVVIADFYPDICQELLQSCKQELTANGIQPARVERVPGALELPFAASTLIQRQAPDALIALGCVIRGETYHFEIVADSCAQGILQVQLQTGVPIGNGVLTVENMQQAKARVDKGAHATRAALDLVRMVRGEETTRRATGNNND